MSAALLERIIHTYDGPASAPPAAAPGDPLPQAEFDDVSRQAAARAAADAEKLLENEQVQQWLAGKTPSQRNRDVFRAVVGLGRHQRDVAADFGITQPRVNQILKQVGAWLGRVVAQRDQALSPAEQLQQSENVTRMQYDAVYATAMQLLAASQQSTTVEKCRRDQAGNVVWTETATRQNRANASLLGHALRSVTERAKFEGTYGGRGEVRECGSTGVGKRGGSEGVEECRGTGVRENSPPPPHSHTPAPPHSDSPQRGSYQPLSPTPADKAPADAPQQHVNTCTKTACGECQPPVKPEKDQPSAPYRSPTRASSPAISDQEYAQLMALADEEFETKFRDEEHEVKEPGPLSPKEVRMALLCVGDEVHEYVTLAVQRTFHNQPPEVQATGAPRVRAFTARLFLRICGYGTAAADQMMRLFDPQAGKLLEPRDAERSGGPHAGHSGGKLLP